MKKINIIVSLIIMIALVIGICGGIAAGSNKIEQVVSNEIHQEAIIDEETQDVIDKTTNDNADYSTTETIESTESEEESLESDSQVYQENISYDGDESGNGISLLGAYQGLTYYSQADSRWASVMYSSINNANQTMKTSACGPTSAAMVVSSSKGTILPTTMAKLAVDKGYRTASSGTAWSYFAFVADYFNFKEFRTVTYYKDAQKYLTQKNEDGSSKYYAVVSCGAGLFTTSGHYIVIVAADDNTITVYDPFLYTGKFNTASRRAAGVKVSGNTAYVSIDSFKEYANYSCFFIFSNDVGEGNPNKEVKATESKNTITPSNNLKVSYTRYVSTSNSRLNVRSSANGTIIGTLDKGTAVQVIETSGGWSKISSPIEGWVSTTYLSSTIVNTTSSVSYKTTVNKTYKLATAATLYSKGNLSGTKYNYKKGTSLKVISHYNSSVDYVYINATKRYAYISTKSLIETSSNTTTNNTSSKIANTVGAKYRLKTKTKLYAKFYMTGTYYTYYKDTQVQIVRNVSSTIDYVKVIKTGRYAYCYKSAYK